MVPLEEAEIYKKEAEKVESLSEQLIVAEQNLVIMQNEHKEKMADLQKLLSDSYLQKEDLSIKLSNIEEQYKLLIEEMEAKKDEIKEKDLIQFQLSNDNETLKMDLIAIQQEFSQADELLKSVEVEKINLEEELSLSKITENNMKEQLEANSCEIDKLVTMVEKYETEMSEKDKQMLSQTGKYEAEIASKEKQILELNVEIERKNAVLSTVKQEYECVCEENCKLKQDLKEKEERCYQLDAEMDDLVKHYETDKKIKDEECEHLTSRLALVEKELLMTNSKLKETLSGTSSSPLTLEVHDQNSLRESIAQLRVELQAKQEALNKKEEECNALDA